MNFGDRTAVVEFIREGAAVVVRETFDAEETHSIDQQRQGWQAILDRFGRHVAGPTVRLWSGVGRGIGVEWARGRPPPPQGREIRLKIS